MGQRTVEDLETNWQRPPKQAWGLMMRIRRVDAERVTIMFIITCNDKACYLADARRGLDGVWHAWWPSLNHVF